MNPEMNQSERDKCGPAPTAAWNMDNSNYWYANECFSKYWRHYNDARQWYINHLHYVNAVNSPLYYPPQMSSAPLQPWIQVPQTGGWKQRKHRRHRKSVTQRESCQSVSSSRETEGTYTQEEGEEEEVEGEEEEEEEFQLEITDAMREFLAKSSESKKKKEVKKTIEKNSENNEQCVNIEDLADQPREASHLPPSERPGARRTIQMRELYGKKAGLIHGMETALQMEFDRIVDVSQPKLWPNMPLKCIFH